MPGPRFARRFTLGRLVQALLATAALAALALATPSLLGAALVAIT